MYFHLPLSIGIFKPKCRLIKLVIPTQARPPFLMSSIDGGGPSLFQNGHESSVGALLVAWYLIPTSFSAYSKPFLILEITARFFRIVHCYT